MNKTELISAVSAKAGFSKVDGKKAVDAVIKTISEEVEKGGKVAILGFGSFFVVNKAARKGVSPRTKQEIDIPARKVVKFKAGVDLAEAVK
jgi:DNA-binding protein HU-beta